MTLAPRGWARSFFLWLSLAVVLTCALGSFGSPARRNGSAGSRRPPPAAPANNGRSRRRRCSGRTDSDSGRWADPVRCGRGAHNR